MGGWLEHSPLTAVVRIWGLLAVTIGHSIGTPQLDGFYTHTINLNAAGLEGSGTWTVVLQNAFTGSYRRATYDMDDDVHRFVRRRLFRPEACNFVPIPRNFPTTTFACTPSTSIRQGCTIAMEIVTTTLTAMAFAMHWKSQVAKWHGPAISTLKPLTKTGLALIPRATTSTAMGTACCLNS